MFKRDLKEKLTEIFGIKKVTFDAPSESFEQDALFVDIASAPVRVIDARSTAKVSGSLTVYSKQEGLPFGFFHKRIAGADWALTKNFFFEAEQDISSSPARTVNISERRMGFLYLYSAQHDPNQGELTSLEIGGCE